MNKFGVVLLDKLRDNILLVKDHPGHPHSVDPEKWSIVNGLFQPDVKSQKRTVIDEIRMNCGLFDVTPHGVLTDKSSHAVPFDHIVFATADDIDVDHDPQRFADVKWFDLHHFLHLPDIELIHPDVKMVAQYMMHGGQLNYLFR